MEEALESGIIVAVYLVAHPVDKIVLASRQHKVGG
jgi:hypothetical protein